MSYLNSSVLFIALFPPWRTVTLFSVPVALPTVYLSVSGLWDKVCQQVSSTWRRAVESINATFISCPNHALLYRHINGIFIHFIYLLTEIRACATSWLLSWMLLWTSSQNKFSCEVNKNTTDLWAASPPAACEREELDSPSRVELQGVNPGDMHYTRYFR